MIVALTIGRSAFKWASRKKLFTAITVLVVLTALFLPFLFRKAGTLADTSCSMRKDVFGNATQQHEYLNISTVDVTVRYAIQYEISFTSGETIMVCSEQLKGIKNFKTDKDLMFFDQTISQFAEKTVSSEAAWIKSGNTRRFFNDEEVFEYFDAFFREYYCVL